MASLLPLPASTRARVPGAGALPWARLGLAAWLLGSLGHAASAQDPAFGSSEALRLRRPAAGAASAPGQEGAQQAPDAAGEEPRAAGGKPERFFEAAFSGEAVWLGLRSPLRGGGRDHFGLGLVVSEEDDLLVEGRLMRFADPVPAPVRLGVGLELFGAFLDEADAEAYGLGLVGSAAYELTVAYPCRVELSLAYAPDQLVLDDGEELVDLRLSFEVDVSARAAAFVGYRTLEVELEDDPDVDLDDALHVGLRLGF